MRTFLFIIGILLHGTVFAQTAIIAKSLIPTTEENITKLRIDYIEPSEQADTAIWQMPMILSNGVDYEVRIIVRDGNKYDRIDGGNIHHYQSHGDTILYLGFENRRALVSLTTPITDIVCPATLGDSVHSTFEGDMIHANRLGMSIRGNAYTVVDGVGSLTDGISAIDSIVRVHRHIEYGKSLAADSVDIEANGNIIDSYVLYRVGLRHPLLESVQTFSIIDGKKTTLDKASFIFAVDSELKHPQLDECVNSDTLQVELTASFDIKSDIVYVFATTTKDCDARILAFDIFGHKIAQQNVRLTSNDASEIAVKLDGRPIGNLLFISIETGDYRWTTKSSVNSR